MAATWRVVVDPVRDQEFDRAFELLRGLVDWSAVEREFPVRANAVYSTRVVLRMLVSQRMSPESSLESAVKRLLETQRDFLPPNKRVVEKTLSAATGAYSRARSRLPLQAARWFAEHVSQSLIGLRPPSFDGRRVDLVDGTTITLAPESTLRRAFPPASNQHGAGVWPVALLVMAQELSSGAALLPAVGAMYGEHAVSETALVAEVIAHMPRRRHRAGGCGLRHLRGRVGCAPARPRLRVENDRRALRRQATLVDETADTKTNTHAKTYALTWRPSAKERATHPDFPAEAAIDVRLHEICLHDSLTLSLVTSLPHSATMLSELYGHRTDIEVDLRNFKVVLSAEQIAARSEDLFHKELLTSQVAYNLVTQFRRQAAALAQEPPRRMSFQRTWTTFHVCLCSSSHRDATHGREQYRQALHDALQDKLPHRPGCSFPRETYPRRPKSTHFKKRHPNQNAPPVK